ENGLGETEERAVSTTVDEAKLEQFMGQLIGHMTGAALCYAIWLGDELPAGDRDGAQPDPGGAPLTLGAVSRSSPSGCRYRGRRHRGTSRRCGGHPRTPVGGRSPGPGGRPPPPP